MLTASEIRDILNREMAIDQEYHMQDIYAFFRPEVEGYTGGKLKHNIRALDLTQLSKAKDDRAVSQPRREYHIRHSLMQ